MKRIICLSIILASLSSTSATGVNSTEKKKITTDSNVCLGTAPIDNMYNKQLIDEFSFSYDKGRIYLNPLHQLNRVKCQGNTTYTLAIKFEKEVFEDLLFFKHHIDLSFSGIREYGVYEEENFSYYYGKEIRLENNILKRIFIKSNTIFISFAFSIDEEIALFDFTYSSYDLPFTRAQLSLGDYKSFPGFTKNALPPCMKKDIELSNEDYYYDLNLNYIDRTKVIDDILNGLVGYDKTNDNYIRPTLIIDEVTNSTEYGKYQQIVLRIKSEDEYKDLTIYIKSYDDLPPVIKMKEDKIIELPYYNFDKNDLLNLFEAEDITPIKRFEIEGQTLFNIGENIYSVTAIDSLNNVATMPFKVIIYDDISPILEVPYLINVSKNHFFEKEKIKELIKANDEIDLSNVELTLDYDNYNKNKDRSGTYYIKVEAKDKSNNVTTKEIPVLVSEKSDLTFYVYGNEVTTYFGNKIDILSTVNALAQNEVIPKANYISYSVISGEDPSVNPLSIGSHKVSVVATNENGESYIVNLVVNVIDEKIKENKSSKSFIQIIIAFFQKIIDKIRSFFLNLFK